MNNPAAISQALNAANFRFVVHSSKLLQEMGNRCLFTGIRAYGYALSDTFADIDARAKEGGADPGLVHQICQRLDDAQDIAKLALSNQLALYKCINNTFRTWQRESASALSGIDTGTPVGDVVGEFMRSFMLQMTDVSCAET